MKNIKKFLAVSLLILIALMLICSCGENTDITQTDSGAPEASDTQAESGTNESDTGTKESDTSTKDSDTPPTDSDGYVSDPNVDEDWWTNNKQ